MDNYLRKDPSIVAPVISDSMYGVKHKAQKNADDDQDEEEVTYLFIIIIIIIS